MVSARAADSSIGLKNNCTQINMKVHCTQTITYYIPYHTERVSAGAVDSSIGLENPSLGGPPTFKPLLAATIPRPQDRGAPILIFQNCPQFRKHLMHTNDKLILFLCIWRQIFEKKNLRNFVLTTTWPGTRWETLCIPHWASKGPQGGL